MRPPSTSNNRWIWALLKEDKEIISTLNKSNDEVRIDVPFCNEFKRARMKQSLMSNIAIARCSIFY